jgi:YD repeat-containing protein
LGAALAASMGWSAVASAQVTIPDEYAKMIQQHSRINTLDGGFFGDHVSLAMGGLEFVQTDVDLPGNNSLAVRVGRRLVLGDTASGHFGDWDLDIPHMHGVFAGPMTSNNWVGSDGSANRCSEFGAPPEATYQFGVFGPDEYWHGTFVYLPGGGDQELLSAIDVPTSGGPYHAGTREGAVVRCVAALASTSEAGSTGEGFEVVTPDGTVYTFNQMVSANTDALKKGDSAPQQLRANGSPAGTRPQQIDPQNGGASTNAASGYVLPRRDVTLYPTKVTDRFGNTVTYTWSSSNPWRLLSIVASDGRQLTLTYSATDPASYQVQTVSDGTHAWTYTANSVTQPDGGVWSYNMHDLAYFAKPHPAASCDTMASAGGSWSGTITAPSGAIATYNVAATIFGRSWVPRQCASDDDFVHSRALEPYLVGNVAITSKTITGPGLPATGLTWLYAYGSPNNCWDPANIGTIGPDAVVCVANTSPTTRTTTVTAPDGSVSRYTFGNQYGQDEGILYKEEHGVDGSTVLNTTTLAYGDLDAAPYATHNGYSPRSRGDFIVAAKRRPQRSRITNQQGQNFSWSVAASCSGMPYCFDTRARPTVVVRSGPSASRTEATTYYDDTALWVLGQVAQVKCIAPTSQQPDGCGTSGTVMSATTFDAGNALPLTTSAFGKLRNTFAYDTTSAIATGQRGTLLTAADGIGNTTTYSSWKRGIPQSVHFPATPDSPSGATRTAVVDNSGWITSVTDENGFVTSYLYDAMGRITQVTYPASDSTAWNTTTSVFAPVASAENGIAAGHWRETISTGNARKVTLFDALWRPVLVREYDSGNAAGTDRYVATAYDKAGRVVDASYPLGTAASALTLASDATWQLGGGRPSGVRTGYDALGRPTSVQQDSELGALTTTTEYLNGFQRRTTDARGNATTERFMAWDSPGFDLPVQIDAPEHQRTLIPRDIFGKPTAITRQEVSP